MSSIPQVSIIIPVYNKEKYLKNTLDIIKNQSFESFEVIVVDDGSSDNSSKILEDYRQIKNFTIVTQPNMGVSVARNNGLQIAKGNWIWFIDADDNPNIDFLCDNKEIIYAENYDIVFAPFMKTDSNNQSQLVCVNEKGKIQSEDLPATFIKHQYTNGFFGYLWCKLIRRSFIIDNQVVFEEGLTLAEDLKFMVALYKCNPRCYFTDSIATKYNSQSDNSSALKEIDYKAQLRIQYEIYEWIKETNNPEYINKIQDRICGYIAYIFIDAFEQKGNLENEINWLNGLKEYKQLLSYERLRGREKKIIKLLKAQKHEKLYRYFKIRLTVRRLYRGVINNEICFV